MIPEPDADVLQVKLTHARRPPIPPQPLRPDLRPPRRPPFEVLATNVVGEEATCASLAVSDGQVFLRTYDALWCFGAAAK